MKAPPKRKAMVSVAPDDWHGAWLGGGTQVDSIYCGWQAWKEGDEGHGAIRLGLPAP